MANSEASLVSTIKDMAGTYSIVLPIHTNTYLQPIKPHDYPSYGDAILLVVPTENRFKRTLLESVFKARAPESKLIHSITLPVDSDVGEQPYNTAGFLGAHNRICNALKRLYEREQQSFMKEKRIGTVIVASIESYIQTDNIDRPTDFGIIVIHNATRHQTTTTLSRGVTVPPKYVDLARQRGMEGSPDHGRVTVGQVLAENVPGLDKRDWQLVLAGTSRYELLKDAVEKMTIMW
jgi:hypothetical protein